MGAAYDAGQSCAMRLTRLNIRAPRFGAVKRAYHEAMLNSTHAELQRFSTRAQRGGTGVVSSLRSSRRRRRVFSCVPFGYDLDMLLLYLHSISSVIDTFLVTESTHTHQLRVQKPAVATEAVLQGLIPPALVGRLRIKLVDPPPICWTHKGYTENRYEQVHCFERWQRFALLGMLADAGATSDDLALFADSDEIASPHVIAALRDCFPFGTDGERLPGKYVLQAYDFTFGVHCQHGPRWNWGPHLFSVTYLRRVLGTCCSFDLWTAFNYTSSGVAALPVGGQAAADLARCGRAQMQHRHRIGMRSDAMLHAMRAQQRMRLLGCYARSKGSACSHATRTRRGDHRPACRDLSHALMCQGRPPLRLLSCPQGDELVHRP